MIERQAQVRRLRTLIIPIVIVLALAGVAVVLLQQPLDAREQRILTVDGVAKDFEVHLGIVFGSLALAILIGIPAGMLLAKGARAAAPLVFGFANLSQAIPGVSILAVALFVPGLGPDAKTAALALAAFSVLPILRNTVVGLSGVDESLLEAARGMGMSAIQVLLRVQFPLAIPVIFAGLRTALILNVGTATLATFIGGGGLGDIIETGIESNLNRVIVVGATLVSCLALLLDWLAGLLEHRLTART